MLGSHAKQSALRQPVITADLASASLPKPLSFVQPFCAYWPRCRPYFVEAALLLLSYTWYRKAFKRLCDLVFSSARAAKSKMCQVARTFGWT